LTLREAEVALEGAGIKTGAFDVLIMAEEASGCSRASLLASRGEDISHEAWFCRFYEMLQRRLRREPLQYIIGKWEFYGRSFTVTPDTLIPRPETEMLVDFAVKHLNPNAVVADLCCGTGAVGISVALEVGCRVICADISQKALDVARQNAVKLGAADKISFVLADVLAGDKPDGEFDMILCNPPYVRSGDIDTLEPELSYEPRLALDGGDDGLLFYRAVTKNYADKLKPGGGFVYEIGYDQADDVKNIAKEHGFDCDVYKDSSGLQRMVVLKKTNRNEK